MTLERGEKGGRKGRGGKGGELSRIFQSAAEISSRPISANSSSPPFSSYHYSWRRSRFKVDGIRFHRIVAVEISSPNAT